MSSTTESSIAKTVPFSEAQLREIVAKHPTPFHIYDEKAIRENAQRLNRAFEWCAEFKEYFAVKATPNPHILKILQEEGFGGDCSSLLELVLCEAVGLKGRDLMFTSNNTLTKEYAKAIELGALINLDDLTHIQYLHKSIGLPETVCFRYNPGPLREGNAIIGKPEEAKYGFTRDQLLDGYRALKEHGVKHFGLHTMVASNELNPDFFVETAQMLFDLCVTIKNELDIRIEFVNLGGGIGIPYRPEETPVNLEEMSKGIESAYNATIKRSYDHRALWLSGDDRDSSQVDLQRLRWRRRLHGKSYATRYVWRLSPRLGYGERERSSRQSHRCRGLAM